MNSSTKTGNILVYSASFIIIITGLHLAKAIIVPFLLSIFITIITAPIMFWLRKKHVPKFISYLLVLTIVILIFSILGHIITSSFDALLKDIPIYTEKLRDTAIAILNWAKSFGYNIPKEQILEYINPSYLFNFTAKTIGNIGSILTYTLLIFIIITFMLFEYDTFSQKIQVISGNSKRSVLPFIRITSNIKHYILIKTITSIITGILVALMLITFDIDYPILWGLLAFLLNYIPTIGSIIAALPALLLAAISGDLSTFIWVTVSYLVINNGISNFAEPKILGDELGISTLVVFLSLVFWGWIFGPIGMLLSVPITLTIKVALDSKPETKWLGILLGSAKSLHNRIKR